MTLLRRALPLALTIALFAASCGGSSPSAPTSAATTKIIAVTGNLAFGNVSVNTPTGLAFTITNSGNATLTITAVNVTGGTAGAGIAMAPTSGAIPAGGSQVVIVTFTPTIAEAYSTVIGVVGDQTSGDSSIDFSGTGAVGPAPPVATKIISTTGNLAFGNVNLHTPTSLPFTIANSGSAPLTFTSLNVTGGTGVTGMALAPRSGAIPAGGSAVINVTFTPTTTQAYSGVINVVGDQTSGSGSINFSGTGIIDPTLFTMSGAGETTFSMPATVTQLDVTASYDGLVANLDVWIGNAGTSCGVTADPSCREIVNAAIGRGSASGSDTYDSGTIPTGGGGTVSVYQSGEISWSMIQVR